jgi:transcriptional regulator with XRE-family HTH domain
MEEQARDLRKILSMNIKKQRDYLGLSQEKLAEKAGISANMIKDIEGFRTWISDKTLIKLSKALEIDIYRLFISPAIDEDEINRAKMQDLSKILIKIKKNIDLDFKQAFKLWGLIEKKK